MRSVLLLPLCLLVSLGCDKPDRQKPDQAAEKAAEKEGPLGEPVATVRACDLFDAYDQNALNADRKYKGKVLQVVEGGGKVWDKAGRYFIRLHGAQSLRTGNVAPAVIGRIDKAAEGAFAKVRPEAATDVVGICMGKRTDEPGTWKGFYVLLDRCRLARTAK